MGVFHFPATACRKTQRSLPESVCEPSPGLERRRQTQSSSEAMSDPEGFRSGRLQTSHEACGLTRSVAQARLGQFFRADGLFEFVQEVFDLGKHRLIAVAGGTPRLARGRSTCSAQVRRKNRRLRSDRI